MSGGVDSSVSAVLLMEQGYEVVGVTMRLYDDPKKCVADPSIDAKKMCDFLHIPHYTLDLTHEFHNCVIKDFIESYASARTPNPCVECNKYMKFGLMYSKAKELGCDYFATGHYANVEYDARYGKTVLKKADSERKDQSYVLYTMPQKLLDKVLFPLGKFHNKEEIRKIAHEHNLPVASKPDSEDICFIPDGDYARFLEENSDISAKPGDIVLNGKVVGKHTGLYHYTIGQRKGIGVTHATPLYVIGFDVRKNQLIVGEEKDLYKNEMIVKDLNFLIDFDHSKPLEVNTKIRYQSKDNPGAIEFLDDETVKVNFAHPVARVTPGQSAVFYVDDVVIGGGKIVK